MTSDELVGASRLPSVGTTIFTVMSALAAKTGAINLGQGFPDFDCDPALVDAVAAAMRAGHNQYPPMTGIPALRQAVSDKIALTTGRSCRSTAPARSRRRPDAPARARPTGCLAWRRR